MAEETKKTVPQAAEEVVSDVPVEKEVSPQPEPEKAAEEGEKEKEKDEEAAAEEKVAESASFKEESNKVDDLVDPEKKALDEFKLLIQQALNNHEFTAPPPAKDEDKKKEEPETETKSKDGEEPKTEEKKEEELKIESCDAPPAETPVEAAATEEPAVEKKVEEVKIESCDAPPAETPAAAAEEPPVEKKVEEAKIESSEAVEEIKETIVHEVTPPCEEPAAAPAAEEDAPPPPSPEKVSIWGVPLLADERSDVILLKFLRARDFKVKEAFTMLKSVVAWRKEFKIDSLVEEEESAIVEGLEKVVFLHGADKEGHPICYNAFGAFQDKELYNNTFGDAEKRGKFLRWYILLLEKNIRKFDFSPDSICTIVQITDLKNMPGLILFKKDFRQATNEALQLLQDNYPEFVAKQVFINVPWWYVAYNRLISPFLTQRTKSKFVFAGPTKTAETLFKYIAPEHVPVQYGGLSKDGETEFTTADSATEETIKPAGKHTVELPVTEACTLVWEVRVVGWEVCYGAEFVPSAEGGYTWVVQKSRKIGPGDEQVVGCSFKIGETGKVVLTFDNQTSKKKKLLYRFKTKPSE
ncbi:hypothetical protein SASPL_103539 [Salvia splendens]|uniref:4-nitrophenyl phosphatase n=1 Tax=Salvia splendens TaxID=180675 RepID=A0A8X9A7P5_SALSN|nr:patellin-3-like [Salvia splendens]KAG6431967.1 hypothetical protein SASPL_103539 [Salvia splendens]